MSTLTATTPATTRRQLRHRAVAVTATVVTALGLWSLAVPAAQGQPDGADPRAQHRAERRSRRRSRDQPGGVPGRLGAARVARAPHPSSPDRLDRRRSDSAPGVAGRPPDRRHNQRSSRLADAAALAVAAVYIPLLRRTMVPR